MNKGLIVAALTAAVAALLGTGYWLGARGSAAPAGSAASASGEPARKTPRILYYRNPMGQPDTSPVPKQDQMGMDYIPVYEGEDSASGTVALSPEKIQLLGVRTEAAQMRELARTVRAVGRVAANERLTYTVAPKFEGWIDQLHVNTTGQHVTKGQPLLEIYSPELVSAQKEYAIAVQGQRELRRASPEIQASMKQLADASLARLRNWDIPEDQLQNLSNSNEVKRALTYRSPVNGIVVEKKAVQGMRFMPGDVLYQIADLSSVWIVGDIFEQDMALVKTGQTAKVSVNAYPGKEFRARVVYVYPTLNPDTRTAQVRLELANPGGLLKPEMYADIELAAAKSAKVLSIPVGAVIDSGKRQVVLVQVADGRFQPREVTLGRRTDDWVEVLTGLAEGDAVVTRANFLIDAESNLRAALSGMQAVSAVPAQGGQHAHAPH